MSLQKSGYIEKTVDSKHILYKDGVAIGSLLGGNNKFGHYAINGTLYNRGLQVLKANLGQVHYGLTDNGYSDVSLNWRNTCINITKENYNKLRQNVPVTGYTKYNPKAIYNIVPSIQTAPTITYTRYDDKFLIGGKMWNQTEDVLYNNVVGITTECVLNAENNVNDDDSPYCCLHYFNPIVVSGNKISLELRVDDHYQSSLKVPEINHTFTIVIATEDGEEVKHTCYAGTIEIDTPIFTTAADKRTWFSLYCIDSRGVSSAVQYLSVYVRASQYVANYKVLTAQDMSGYGIIPNTDDRVIGYNNKLGFTQLFSAVKNAGYNGVIFPENTIYYISPHKNINSARTLVDAEHKDYLGSQKYYYVVVNSNHKLESYEEITKDDVTNDVKNIYRYGSSYPNFSNEIIIKGGVYWKTLTSQVQATLSPLRTWAKDPIPLFTNQTDVKTSNGEYYAARGYYFVVNTAVEGDHILFPDNFTIHLNNSTLACVSHYDLNTGNFIVFENNVDTHIINGTIKGCFEGYDFWSACLAQSSYNPTEHLANIKHDSSHFCSYENLDISRAVGYDFVGNSKLSGTKYLTSFNNNTCVDIVSQSPGDVVQKNGMVTSNLVEIGDTTQKMIMLTRVGYKVWLRAGTRKEIFLSFYDINQDYITTVKSRINYLVPCPDNAKYVRLSGYGQYAASSSQGNDSYWTYTCSQGQLAITKVNMDEGHLIQNCFMHDCRSVALGVFESRQCLIDNCEITRTANATMLNATNHSWTTITPLAMDFEAGEQLIKYNAFMNCVISPSPGVSWTSGFVCHNCEFLTFVNNTGISISNRGGLESGLIKGNHMPTYNIVRSNYSVTYPAVEYINNTIDALIITKNADRAGYDEGDMRIPMKDSIFPANGWHGLILKNTIMDNCIYFD